MSELRQPYTPLGIVNETLDETIIINENRPEADHHKHKVYFSFFFWYHLISSCLKILYKKSKPHLIETILRILKLLRKTSSKTWIFFRIVLVIRHYKYERSISLQKLRLILNGKRIWGSQFYHLLKCYPFRHDNDNVTSATGVAKFR